MQKLISAPNVTGMMGECRGDTKYRADGFAASRRGVCECRGYSVGAHKRGQGMRMPNHSKAFVFQNRKSDWIDV